MHSTTLKVVWLFSLVAALGAGFWLGGKPGIVNPLEKNPEVATPGNTFKFDHVQFTLPESWQVQKVGENGTVEVEMSYGLATLTIVPLTAEEIKEPDFVDRTYAIPGGKVYSKLGSDYIIFNGQGYGVSTAASGGNLDWFDIDLLDFERSARWME